MATLDYYSVLGVRQSATAEEIRKAYRGKCKALHPDVNKSPDATRIMQEVNEAYRVLHDRYLRLQYDKEYVYTTTVAEDPYPEEEDYCDAHSEADGFDPMRNWRERTDGCYEWSSYDSGKDYGWSSVIGFIIGVRLLSYLFEWLF